jgi:hypothetical protein
MRERKGQGKEEKGSENPVTCSINIEGEIAMHPIYTLVWTLEDKDLECVRGNVYLYHPLSFTPYIPSLSLPSFTLIGGTVLEVLIVYQDI